MWHVGAPGGSEGSNDGAVKRLTPEGIHSPAATEGAPE